MLWNEIIGNFCESKIYGYPEILNCLSCVFISLFPYIGLKYANFKNYRVKNIMSFIFIAGFTSFGYHWSGYYLFKHLDEIPMIMGIWIGIVHFLSIINTEFIFTAITNLYFIIILSINAVPKFNFLFPILFGIPCFSLIPLAIAYFIKYRETENKIYNKKQNRSHQLALIGTIICILSAITWIITECYCNSLLIFGHSIWHFGMPLGMYYIIAAAEYHEQLKINKNIKVNYLYKIIPVINDKSV